MVGGGRALGAGAFLALLVLQAAPVRAQAAGPQPGDTVRVRSPAFVHGSGEGRLLGRSPAGIELALTGGETVLVPLAEVQRLEVRRGSDRATWTGALLGLGTGAIAFFVVQQSDEADDEIDPACGELQCYGSGDFALFAAAGTAAGAAIGYLIRVPRWEEVPVAVGVGLVRPGSSSARGLRIQVRLPF